MFILNRETGEPVHGVEERPVPAGDVPGRAVFADPADSAQAAAGGAGQHRTRRRRDRPTTPRPRTRPPAASCGTPWATTTRGPYTPLRLRQEGTPPSLVFPGMSGGVNWGGTAYDPELGYIFVNSKDQPISGWMDENPLYGPDTEDQVPYVRAGAQPFEAPIYGRRRRAPRVAAVLQAALGAFVRGERRHRRHRVGDAAGHQRAPARRQATGRQPERRRPDCHRRRARVHRRHHRPQVPGVRLPHGRGAVVPGVRTTTCGPVPMTYEGSDGRQYLAANVSAPAQRAAPRERAAGRLRPAVESPPAGAVRGP